jgi:hypothetical protein
VKNLYKKIIPFLLLFILMVISMNNVFAQKNMKLKILTVKYEQTTGTDCDGHVCVGGNGRIDIAFDIDDGATDVDETCHEGAENTTNYTWNANFNVWDRNYDYACQWPGSGNIGFIIEAWDRDGNVCIYDQCAGGGFLNASADKICNVNIDIPWPSNVNAITAGTPQTCTFNANFDGGGNCGGTVTVTYQWEVTGNWKPQTSFDYICGARDLGTLPLGGTFSPPSFSNSGATTEDICSANEPYTSAGDDESVWFKFKTSANPGSNINVDVTASGALCAGWTKVYAGPDNLAGCPFTYTTNHFTQIAQVGSTGADLSDIDIKCPPANQTYYVQVEMCTPGLQVGCIGTCDVGTLSLVVTDNGKQSGPDRICDALDLGQAAYGGPLSNNTNVDLVINNQTNRCASVAGGEPDNMTGSLDRTVWYKFRTPASTTSNLPHTYQIIVSKQSGSNIDAFPVFSLYKDLSGTGTRTCESFANLLHIDSDNGFDVTNSDANLDNVCLDPNTWYYIQVDHTSAFADFVNFGIRIRKDAYKPGDNICEATDLGYITTNGLANGVTTGVNWSLASKFTGAPYFGLPHTNRCASAEPGEPQASPGGPNPNSGTHTATVWYKFTTGSGVPPDWIYWYQDDNALSKANRGSVCVGLGFNSRVTFFKNTSTFACPVGGNLEAQDEISIPGETCDAVTGIGFGAPCYQDMFRLKCPEPNTTYYVQVEDAGAISICYEGQWSFDNSNHNITTASTLGGAPINDTICGAIDLGTVPNAGQLAPATIFDNFCATPDLPWRADFTQPLDRDVWFRFRPPVSGSVRITAQSAPAGSPGVDDDLDIQATIWEPILGDGTNAHCSDPRFLWTPIISQDHGLQESVEAGVITTTYYDIYNTCGNSALCNEGNSLVATCLDPNKYYYLQVDGGDYLACDLFDAGDCIMGYFRLQIADAGLGLYNAANPADVGTPFSSLGVPNATLRHDEPCFAQNLPINNSATAYGSLNWTNMTNRCATSINDPVPSEWLAKNASTDKTVWARFVAPVSGKVKIRAENRSQLKGDGDYHENINLQLALYQTSNCFDKWRLTEVGNGNGFDGGGVEIDPLNDDDYTGICVPCTGTCGFDEYYVARCLVPGQTYYIMIDGDAGYTCAADVEDVEGDFRISVQEMSGIPASTNDSICQAYNMTPISNTVNAVYTTPIAFNNECASIDMSYEGSGKVADEIEGALFDFDVEHTLWFRFVAPSTGKVRIEAVEDGGVDDIDLGIAIFDIPTQNCADIQTRGFKFDDDYDPAVFGIANSDDEEITVSCLVPGRTYWVQIDGNRNVTTCGPAFSGTDCETGQFRVRVTTLAADPTYATNVAYTTPVASTAGGNDNFCQSHSVFNASGAYNPLNQNTYLHPGETIVFNHNNRCATSELNEPEANGWDLNPFDTDSDPTVWYTFNTGPSLGPLRPGDITIRITNPSGTCFDPDLDLYEYNGTFNTAACNTQALSGTQFNPLLRVGEGAVFSVLSPREEEIKITCPKPNTRYFLRVLGTSTCPLFGTDQGDYTVSIAMSNINIDFQTNDNICGATNVGSGTLNTGGVLTLTNQNNICATQEIGEPNTSQNAVQSEPEYDETVWHKFTTSANPGEVQVVLKSLLGVGGYNSVPSITIYKYVPSGNPCSATPFANIADVASNSGFATVLGAVTIDSAKVTLPCVSPNTTYYVQVDGGDASLFGITLPTFTDNFYYDLTVRDLGAGTGRPVNDMIANAIPADNAAPIDGLLPAGGTLNVSGHNRCATCEAGENGDFCGTNTTDHTAAFNAEDETVWYYFTTPATPGTISITVADDPAVSGTFSPNFTLYYNNGSFPLFRVTNGIGNQLIQEGPTRTAVTNTVTGSYTCLLPNTRYFLQIDGNDNVPFTDDQNSFTVTITDDGSGTPGPTTPTNYDLICSANVLTIPANGTTGVLPRTNRCAWEEAGEPNTSNNMGGTGDDVTSNDYDETVWFTFVPPADGDITMVLEPTSGITGGINYVVYQMPNTSLISCSGTPADIPNWSQLTEIASGTGLALNTIGTTDQVTETWPCLLAGRRYYIQVDGNDWPATSDVGNFNIQLTHASKSTPVNDNICGIGATPATGNMGTFTTSATVTATLQDNRCATQEVGEPGVNGPYNDITSNDYDHTLWYRFVASNTDGTYTVSITNVGGDEINGYVGVYRQDATVCSGAVPTFGNLSLIKESPVVNAVTNNESLTLECWEIEEGRTYFIQVQGFDAVGGLDAGNNFNVAVNFTSGTTNPADNICTAPLANLGTTYNADNRCATTQTGEPNLSPSPQNPSDGSSYDETLWYRFVAPASGEVRISTSAYSSVLLSLNADLYSVPAGYNCAVNGFTGLVREDNTSTLTSVSTNWDLRCLVPGNTYYVRFDGNDATTDRGTWNFVISNIDAVTSYPTVVNDEPCGAIDVTQFVRTASQGPCTADGQYYANSYSILDAAIDIDRATRSLQAVGCNGESNCNDYWFKFTVPLDATGVRIQGNDEYPLPTPINNSHQHIGVYRAVAGCSGTLQQINCGDGGFGSDVDFSIAAYPGETLYLQVFNENAPTAPTNPTFGFCISVDCPAKETCIPNNIVYGQPQCWNMNTNGVDLTPQYYDCLPGDNNSVNYVSFTTDCDGTPVDTVTVIFSVTEIGCGVTAMSMFLDQTPCAAPIGQYDDILVNCAVFEEVLGGTTATNFSSTFILPACATYVMQIISDENEPGCASAGQVIILKSTLPPTSVLPVELTSFTGYNDGDVNVLNWVTASERNTLKFEVEKSTDGVNFSYIGERPAAGNSSVPTSYTLTDTEPLAGNNYYRLKMIDQDNTFEYSNIINIKVAAAATDTKDGILSVYPNPTTGKLNVVYQAVAEQKVRMDVFNVIGQYMLDRDMHLMPGIHTLEIDATDFATGMYIINMTNASNGNKHQAKFVKE